jgi:hypothetical protein
MNLRKLLGGIAGTVGGLVLGGLLGVGVCLLCFREPMHEFWMSVAVAPFGALAGGIVGGWLGAGRRMGDLTWNLLFRWNLGLLQEREDRKRRQDRRA